MTPIEAAVNAYRYPEMRSAEAHTRAIITAFLDAAAGDDRIAQDIGVAVADCGSSNYIEEGLCAILALKEEVNATRS